ncbi:MAG: D-tyrosyl-tRNA(Tyr) deacylase [Bacilli bacterium]|nr:D-tyrosyl-tRNA(Tyr) deacylase [Bacilli bacterium]
MRLLVQRSDYAKCVVDSHITGEIESGLVVFVGFTDGDGMEQIEYLAKKLVNLRIFPDENDVMNKSILDFGGSVLSISQFTLYADCNKGNRPSYVKAMKSEESSKLYELFNEELRKYVKVEVGVFGGDMNISLTNVGPTTILLER